MIKLICDACKRERININQYRITLVKYDVKKNHYGIPPFGIMLTDGVQFNNDRVERAKDLCDDCYRQIENDLQHILFPAKSEAP